MACGSCDRLGGGPPLGPPCRLTGPCCARDCDRALTPRAASREFRAADSAGNDAQTNAGVMQPGHVGCAELHSLQVRQKNLPIINRRLISGRLNLTARPAGKEMSCGASGRLLTVTSCCCCCCCLAHLRPPLPPPALIVCPPVLPAGQLSRTGCARHAAPAGAAQHSTTHSN